MKKLLILFSCCAINFNCSSQPIAPDVIPAPSIPDPSPIVNFKAWENYIGHTGFNKSNTNYQWRRIVRQGRFDPTTTSGFNTAVTILSANHLMFGSNTGYPGANDIGNANADKPDNAAFSLAQDTIPFDASTWQTLAPAARAARFTE